MATIKTCDWLKKRLARDEETFMLTLNGQDYEISAEALNELKTRLDGDEAPLTHKMETKPLRPIPAVVAVQVDDQPNTEPTEAQDEAPEAPTGPQIHPNATPLTVPPSTKMPLPMPTRAQADTVIAESVRFQEGTLRALTPGKARTSAQDKLKTEWEARFEDNKPERQLPERFRK